MDSTNSAGVPGDPILFAAFFAFSIWALIGARGWKQKMITVGIIFAWMAAGFGVGVLLGGPTPLGAQLAAHFTSAFGAVGAFGCTRRNKRQAKKTALVAPVPTSAA
jgi:hypothetical protein